MILPDVDEALELLRLGVVEVSLIITNHPAEFIDFANEVPVLYMAAAPDQAVAARFRACRTLQKPFSTRSLIDAVDALVSRDAGVLVS